MYKKTMKRDFALDTILGMSSFDDDFSSIRPFTRGIFEPYAGGVETLGNLLKTLPPGESPEEMDKVHIGVNLEGTSVKPKKKAKKKKKDVSAASPLSARARARLLCRVMELRISITRYYLQEAQYMDRVRSRVALSLGAYDESGEWKYGRKVLSALESFDRDKPQELLHDIALLRDLESQRTAGRDDVPDGDLRELAVCLEEEVDVLRASLQAATRSVVSFSPRLSAFHATRRLLSGPATITCPRLRTTTSQPFLRRHPGRDEHHSRAFFDMRVGQHQDVVSHAQD